MSRISRYIKEKCSKFLNDGKQLGNIDSEHCYVFPINEFQRMMVDFSCYETTMFNLASSIHLNAVTKGFWLDEKILILMQNYFNEGVINDPVKYKTMADDFIISRKIMLVVTELGESIETLRTNRKADLKAFEESEGDRILAFENYVKDSFGDELADAIIRLLDIAVYKGLNMDKHIAYKMEYNAERPYKHGKEF